MIDQICSLCSRRDFVSECFWFGSDAVNASGKATFPSWLRHSPTHESRHPHRLDDLAHTGGRKHPCTFLLFALNTTNTRYDNAPFKIHEVNFLVLGMKREYSRVNHVSLLTTRGKYSQKKKMGGGVGPLSKILIPYLWPKSAIFPTLFMTWPRIRNPIYDLTLTSKSCFIPSLQ